MVEVFENRQQDKLGLMKTPNSEKNVLNPHAFTCLNLYVKMLWEHEK
jgi:hypothetical protein